MSLVDDFFIAVSGKAKITIRRVDGTVITHERPNTPIAAGLNKLASRGVANTTSLFNWIAVGTFTDTASLGSTDLGECTRKLASTITSSNETIILVSSFGGFTESITSLELSTAGIINHPTSGTGEFLNMLTGIDAVLADSDFLELQVEVRVGSHAL